MALTLRSQCLALSKIVYQAQIYCSTGTWKTIGRVLQKNCILIVILWTVLVSLT